jgi:hypothetical protein
MNRLFGSLLLALLASSPAHAKDLRGRFAAGFNQQFGDAEISAISGRYALPTKSHAMNVQLEANFGFDTVNADTGGKVFTGARLIYGVVAEDNMNLFLAGGAGVLTAAEDSTVRLQPAMGADIFFFGLENLALTIEWGLNLDMGDKPRTSTTAAVGAHYWF